MAFSSVSRGFSSFLVKKSEKMLSSPLSFSPACLGSSSFSRIFQRSFGAYEGQPVKSEDLIKKSDDWVIEETNFCLGRVAPVRFKETDDLAHRVLHLMDSQLVKMHTRLRDGTCIPVMGLYILDVVDKPTPLHQCMETPLLKWTWDHTYSEAYEEKKNPETKK
ncbi:hypothetical protein CSUI_009861 [Cystoisospora suis]|uniref:Uncharacterized protein n=1 Tax=Cystoisospora suis TaxID=483139 RepID=A0A2C6KIZ0_9APIC|nr:hypothetical protein CSUI_009861 [Cystoisospora suis]